MAQTADLLRRASAVFPGGKHTRWPLQQLNFGPTFIDRAEGCSVWDIDGKEYTDYMSGFGASVLGYNHPTVEAAAQRQTQRSGALLTAPTPLSVELAEKLVSLRPGAEWAILAKNGTDVTNAARVSARAATGRRRILRAMDSPDGAHLAYHGASPQWLKGGPGVLAAESSDHEVGYVYNDLTSVEHALQALDGDCAAIFVGSASYPYSGDMVAPTKAFVRGLRELADRAGAMIVLDEIRTNFRVGTGLTPGHWAEVGDDNDDQKYAPDMYCQCKALANGHPIAALLGNNRARGGAASITASGTYWLAGPPMAAALATLELLGEDGGMRIRLMQRLGKKLCEGLVMHAAAHGVGVRVSGPPALPFMTFDRDKHDPVGRPTAMEWCSHMAERGYFMHPYHNWYITASHNDAIIDATLDAANEAFVLTAANADE
jgi:glutamate-1-semialdehyde 2,1-aminomutase